MPMQYKSPIQGQESSVGKQLRDYEVIKKALIEARTEQYFMPLADVKNMPKHMGKTLKGQHYIPILDDQNINDEGIDAAGVAIANKYEVLLKTATDTLTFATTGEATAFIAEYGSGTNTAEVVTIASTNRIVVETEAVALTVVATDEAAGSIHRRMSGNLYGSSRDVGTVTAKLPTLTENGGRVNRVGIKRKEIEGTIEKYGFFYDYTEESLNFDSDEMLEEHLHREVMNAAHKITEDLLMIDLLNAAGVIRYPGSAMSASDLDDTATVTYRDLLQLSIDLDNNRCPKKTTMITGTRNVDTKTIMNARIMYIGSELLPTLHEMKDLHNERAFVTAEKYAAGTTLLNGEVGSIGHFRFVVVPEMAKWAGAGADSSAVATHYETADRFDVFPMLVVGEKSFSTIGFQTNGKTVKFTIYHRKPGENAVSEQDPFGETGIGSIKWYYGFLLKRPERIALFKTAAAM